jgi:hypothetical protein
MTPEASLQSMLSRMLLCPNEDYLDARINKGKPLAWTLLCEGTREISNTGQPRLSLASHESRAQVLKVTFKVSLVPCQASVKKRLVEPFLGTSDGLHLAVEK